MTTTMLLFPTKIHRLREEKKLFQKQLADALSIDIPMYSRIERGERRAKKEQISIIACLLQTDLEELLTLWLADQVNAVVSTERSLAKKVLTLVGQSLNNLE